MIEWWYWNDEYWKDYPSIPHMEKFVHKLGTVQLFDKQNMTMVNLVSKFANDK